MITIETNKKKLTLITESLDMIGESMNIEIYSKKGQLQILNTLNLSSDGIGILDDQLQKLKDDIRFLEAQFDLLHSVIVLAKQR